MALNCNNLGKDMNPITLSPTKYKKRGQTRLFKLGDETYPGEGNFKLNPELVVDLERDGFQWAILTPHPEKKYMSSSFTTKLDHRNLWDRIDLCLWHINPCGLFNAKFCLCIYNFTTQLTFFMIC